MKKQILLLLVFFSAKLFAQNNTDTGAYKFILDYAIPASPGFTVLDAAPQQVSRGSAAKPLVVNAFTNFLQTGRLDPGLAVDFSPYILLGGGFKNLNEYRKDSWKRMLANSILSLAMLKNSKDTLNTDIGVGARITFHDDHDLLSNNATAVTLANDIGNALAGSSTAPTGPGVPDDEIGTAGNPQGTVVVDMAPFYTKAFNTIKNVAGFALSAGGGYRTTARSSSLTKDSLTHKQGKFWLSGTRYTTGGFDIYGTVQGSFADSTEAKWTAGIALGSKNRGSNLGAELTYDFFAKEWNYGATFEIKLFNKFTYVVSLAKRTFYVNGVDVKNGFRVISNLRLNLFGH